MGNNGQPTLPDANTPTGAAAALVTGQIVMADLTLYVVDETKLDNLSAKNDEIEDLQFGCVGPRNSGYKSFCRPILYG